MRTCFGPSASSSRRAAAGAGLVALAVALACATPLKVDDFYTYRDVELAKSDVMPPPSVLRGAPKRVVVAEPEMSSLVGRNPVLSEMLTGALEVQVEGAGAQVIRRDEVGSLLDEVRRFEQEGRLRGSSGLGGVGSLAADYALLSRVDSLDMSGRFVDATVDDNGRTIAGPWCQYTIVFKGSARYYDLAKVRSLTTFPVEAQKTVSVETRNRQCSGSDVSASAVQEVAEAAAHSARTHIKNPLASRGYVVAARSNGERMLFRISMGREANLQAGAKLYLYTVRKSVNQLSGATEFEDLRIAEARLTDQIGEGFAWVAVENAQDEQLVRIGDFVQPSYEKSFMEESLGVDPSTLLPGVGSP
jgi:hypothetical protein